MANAAKRKGSSAEREVAAILNDELGLSTRRALGAEDHILSYTMRTEEGDDEHPLSVIIH